MEDVDFMRQELGPCFHRKLDQIRLKVANATPGAWEETPGRQLYRILLRYALYWNQMHCIYTLGCLNDDIQTLHDGPTALPILLSTLDFTPCVRQFVPLPRIPSVNWVSYHLLSVPNSNK